MANENLMFSDFLAQLDQLGKGEWTAVYASQGDNLHGPVFYSALIKEDKVGKSLEQPSWDLRIGDDRPGFCFHFANGEQIASYQRYSEDGVEPLILKRSFHSIKGEYWEVVEEFRLYFNLFDDRQNNRLTLIDDDGDEEEAVLFLDNEIKIKTRLIKEFLAAKEMRLALFFDESRFCQKELAELGLQEHHETRKSDDFVLEIGVKDCTGMALDGYRSCGLLIGKKLISAAMDFKPSLSPQEGKEFVDFIIGVDENGGPIRHTCDEERLANYFGKNPGSPQFVTPVFFKKGVLSKYYSEPAKYSVEDGYLSCGGLWGLRMDNNHPKYVMAFLGDLGRLSYKEQLHWRSFNVESGKMSRTAFARSIEGKFADPESPALYLKQKFTSFQERWEKAFGWKLFRPMSQGDEYYFKTLRMPLTNEQKEFDEQVLTLAKLFIDSLNEAELGRGLLLEKEDPKGLDKLEGFLSVREMQIPQMIEFLRKFQALRSTAAAHRKGEKYEKLKEFFSIGKKDLPRVFEDIVTKFIWTLNTLETNLLN